MIITRLQLANWRNFKQIDLALRDRVFVVGPNAIGKSNLLDALRFLRDVADPVCGGLRYAVDGQRRGIKRIRSLHQQGKVVVGIVVTVQEGSTTWTYGLRFTEGAGRDHPVVVHSEIVTKGEETLVARPDEADKADPERLSQTALQNESANHRFRPLARFFGSILYQHLVPQLVKENRYFAGVDIPGDPFGIRFIERVAKVGKARADRLLRLVEKELRTAIPNLKELRLGKDPKTGLPHLEVRYQHWRAIAARQDETDFSDGTLRLIALLWLFLDQGGPLLLEEPEINLNGAIVREIPRMIWRLQQHRQRQVIISSHSADLLADTTIDASEIVILRPGKDGTQADTGPNIMEVISLLDSGATPAEAVLPIINPRVEGMARQLSIFDEESPKVEKP